MRLTGSGAKVMRGAILLAGLLMVGPAQAQAPGTTPAPARQVAPPAASAGAAPAAAPALAAPAAAATPSLSPQQERMRACNAQAAEKKLAGNDRQAFMSGCLSGNANAAFKAEGEATTACGTDKVVWANSDSQIFHAGGSQFFGKTAEGAFMCQATAAKAGYRAAGARAN
jgi:hypothetical protein